MYFVRSGFIYLTIGSLWSAGYDNRLWFSSAFPDDLQAAFYSYLFLSTIYPSSATNRYSGFSLRLHLHYSPLYFVRSGLVHPPNASIWSAASYSDLWSSTADPSTRRTFDFHTSQKRTYLSNSDDRYSGLSLRSSISIFPHLSLKNKSS